MTMFCNEHLSIARYVTDKDLVPHIPPNYWLIVIEAYYHVKGLYKFELTEGKPRVLAQEYEEIPFTLDIKFLY